MSMVTARLELFFSFSGDRADFGTSASRLVEVADAIDVADYLIEVVNSYLAESHNDIDKEHLIGLVAERVTLDKHPKPTRDLAEFLTALQASFACALRYERDFARFEGGWLAS